MDHSQSIARLFNGVRETERTAMNVRESGIRVAFSTLANAYKDDGLWMRRRASKTVDFGDASLRCAYLHKFAMVHAGMVNEIFELAYKMHPVKEWLEGNRLQKICSLGGGPGSEIVGLALALADLSPELRSCDVTVVDISRQWEGVFRQAEGQLRNLSRELRARGNLFRRKTYLQANLLDCWDSIDPSVVTAIKEADLITMVKFVSAAASRKTNCMLKNIFNSMKPGAMVLFVDNASGGFREAVEQAAEVFHLRLHFSDEHYLYREENFRSSYCGADSQFQTRVCAKMWQKTDRDHDVERPYIYDDGDTDDDETDLTDLEAYLKYLYGEDWLNALYDSDDDIYQWSDSDDDYYSHLDRDEDDGEGPWQYHPPSRFTR